MQTHGGSAQSPLPFRRRIVGAFRLAWVFAAGVTTIELAWWLLRVKSDVNLEGFVFIAGWAVTSFMLAFLLPGLARLTGLIALVVLVSALWAWEAFVVHLGDIQGVDFVAWTLFAAPLVLTTSRVLQRVPPSLGRRQWNRWTGWALMISWAAVAFVGVELESRPSWLPVMTWNAVQALWIALPPPLTLREFLRVRRRWPRASTPNESLKNIRAAA